MVTILAEKNDMARKIAAALDGIKLDDGTVVTFNQLSKYEKAVKAIQAKKGYIPITFMGEECAVTHARGHLCTLWDTVDYDPEYKNWKNLPVPYIPKYYNLKVIPSTTSQYKIVKELFDKSDWIINATDYEREGELIFTYIYEKTKCKKPYKRAHYSSTTEEELIRSFSNLKSEAEVKNSENAGRCRSIADWLIGINCTVAATLKANTGSVLSLGRVQTPTLAMIVDREKAIQNFVSKTYYVPTATFTTDEGETYVGENDTKYDDYDSAVNCLCSLTGRGEIKSIERKTEKINVPSLYSLSLLQMEANKKFGYTADETLNITQKLYEHGYVTYPRTNSAFLPEDYKASADRALSALALLPEYESFLIGKSKIYDDRFFNDKKVESHFAIVPTHVTPKELTENERNIYDLICRSLIMTIYPPAKVEKVKVVTVDNTTEFVTKGSSILEKGWMEVGGTSKEKFLPSLVEGDSVRGKYEIKEKKTEPPKRYTEADLLRAMVTADKDADEKDLKSLSELGVKGIGTEATRAATIELLVKRNYIERSKKSIVPTPKGISLIDGLPLEEIKSAKLTAMWENRLYEVERGNEKPRDFIKDIETLTKDWANKINSDMKMIASPSSTSSAYDTNMKCPLCGAPVRTTPFGYGCSKYKEGCKFAINKTICDKKLTDKQIETLLTKGITNEIKGFTSKKTGKKFSAKLALEEGKVVFKFD